MLEYFYYILPFLGFAFSTSITPGANNIMLTTAGANYGYFKTIPQLLGIAFGFLVLMLAIAFGLGILLTKYPALHLILKYVGVVYLLYLSWKIASSHSVISNNNINNITFSNAAFLQWVNPKVWGMAVTAMTTFNLINLNYYFSSIVLALLFVLIYIICGSIWILFGIQMKNYMSDHKKLKIFNIIMGSLLAITAVWMLYE